MLVKGATERIVMIMPISLEHAHNIYHEKRRLQLVWQADIPTNYFLGISTKNILIDLGSDAYNPISDSSHQGSNEEIRLFLLFRTVWKWIR